MLKSQIYKTFYKQRFFSKKYVATTQSEHGRKIFHRFSYQKLHGAEKNSYLRFEGLQAGFESSKSKIEEPFTHDSATRSIMKYAEYIKKVDITSLWSGRKHIVWTLRPDVNVLSGRNGEGKSTILNKLVHYLHEAPQTGELQHVTRQGVRIDFHPQSADCVRYDLIRSFDRQIVQSEALSKITDQKLWTELDWQLYLLQRRYLDYQVNVGNRMIALLTKGSPEARQEAEEAAKIKTRFQDMIDDLFAETGKTIDRQSNELQFQQYDETLSPYVLSSGEKQILLILLTALTEDRQPYVFFMDEPEASLHFEWQKQLISLVRELNPRAQIILTTHSPAVIMDGWQDAVTEVSDITLNGHKH